MRIRACCLVVLLFTACRTEPTTDPGGGTSGNGNSFCARGEPVAGLSVASGFCVRKFASVPTARVMAFAPNGDLFVSSPSAPTAGGAPAGTSAIYVLRDDGSGVASVSVYRRGDDLATVHGLAFAPNRLLYTVDDRVNALAYAVGDRSGQGKTPTQIADLSDIAPNERWTHGLTVAADGTVYVSRGRFDDDSCPPPAPRSGAILAVGTGHSFRGDIVVGGLRNALFLRCKPWGCFGAELTGDNWDGIGGREKLIQLKAGDDYGYPCCVDHDVPRPGLSPPPDCSRTAVSLQTYPLHDTPFGFDWDVRNEWPGRYRGALFVGMHGSFDVGPWAGTRLGWVPADPSTHRPQGELIDFVTGFGAQGPVVGRVADVLFGPDGRLFFTDDQGGAVYWIAPAGLQRP